MFTFTKADVRPVEPEFYLHPPLSSQALESVQLKQEATHIEEERIQVLNNMEELEQKMKDLDNQMEESLREVRDWT